MTGRSRRAALRAWARQRERYETQRLVQRLMQKLPTLDYLSWADQGVPRPETYTKENLTDYVPRIEQLANYPWEMTKEMWSEAKEVINTAHPVGTIGDGGSLVNFDPYRQALAAKDDEAAAKWADLFYKLDGNVHTKQYAVGKGFMDGTGYTSAMDVITQLSPLEQSKQEFKAFQNGADLAAKKEPALNSAAYLAGRYAQLRTLGELTGMGLNALGASGPYVPYIRAGLTFGASQAIQESGDLATGRISLPEYLNHLSKAEKQGMLAQALGELFDAGYYGAHYGGHGMGNGVPQLPSGTGASTGTSLMPQTGAPANSLINIRNRDIVAIAGALQERGVGARDAILTAIDLAEIKRNAKNGQVVEAEEDAADFDDLYEQMYPDSVDPYSKIRYNSDGTIVVTDDWTNKGHQSIPKYYRPNAVLETVSPNGQHDRTIYGKDGWFTTQIHGGDHCKSKQHPFGIHGEHAHDYYIDPIAKSVKRTTRELTPIERIQHADIIGR